MTYCMILYMKNLRVYTKMQRQISRPNCMRTGNDKVMNASYDFDDQLTLTDLSLDKQEPYKVLLGGLKLKDM